MPIDSRHPDYSSKLSRWARNRDAYEGEDMVRANAEATLFGPGGLDDAEFTRYKSRAKWFNATARTVEGLNGLIFQKPPEIQASPQVEEHLENVTLTGMPAIALASRALSEVQLMGRYGILLDYDNTLFRPYWSGIPCESIINWHESYVGGQPKLVMLVIKEYVDRMSSDYEIERIDRYRLCHINPAGQYEVILFEEFTEIANGRRFMTEVERYIPTRRLRPLDFIPFQFFGAYDLTPAVAKGPLDDLVNINYSYYRHSADYEQALFLTAMPKWVITGHNLNEGERVPVGSMDAWVFPNPEAKAYLVDFPGQGLGSHERAIEADKQEMATLGARLLEETPGVQETLGAVQLRHSGETGNLKSITNLISRGLTNLLRWHSWWNGNTENVEDERFSFSLNTDLSTTRLTPQEMQALVGLWQAGAISKRTLFHNLESGEIIPPETTFEDEEALIELEAPARIPFGETEQEPEEADEQETDEEEDAA